MPLNLPTQNLVANETTHAVGGRSFIWNGEAWNAVRAAAVSATSLTCTVTSSKASLFTGETASITFTFSEAVTGFDLNAVTSSNGTLAPIAGAGSSYTTTFTPSILARNEYTAVVKVLANKVAAVRDLTLLNKESSAATIDLFLNAMAQPALSASTPSPYITSTAARSLNLQIFPTSATVAGLAVSDITVEGGGTVSTLSTTGSTRTFIYTPPAATIGTAYLYVKATAFTANGLPCDASPRLKLNLITAGVVPTLSLYAGFGASGIGAGVATLKITPPLLRADIHTPNPLQLSDIALSPTNSGLLSNLRAAAMDDFSYLVDFQAGTNVSQACTFSIAANAYQYSVSGSLLANAGAFLAQTINAIPLALVSRNPEAGATNTSPQTITLTFNKTLVLVDSSKITVRKNSSTGTGVTFTASISGSVLSITPTGGVDVSSTYYVSLASGAVSDGFANAAPAVAGYTFATSAVASGEQIYSAEGTYSWLCPANVTSVCAVAVGMGGTFSGGSLGWKNAIAVTPGNSYTVSISNSYSYFVSLTAVNGGGGNQASSRNFVGDDGGLGGLAGTTDYDAVGDNRWHGGGGGAGGYLGNGGAGGNGSRNVGNAGAAGTGGGGGGGSILPALGDERSPGGGGVGLYGTSTGSAGAGGGVDVGGGGAFGDGGGGGGNGVARSGAGGDYGGGAGNSYNSSSGTGGKGAVRIMWGLTPGGAPRSFPANAT